MLIRKTLPITAIAIGFIAFLGTVPCIAQSYVRSNLAVLPTNHTEDSTGKFGYSRVNLGGGYALINRLQPTEKTMQRLYLNANAGIGRVQYQPYFSDFTTLSLQAGLSYLWLKPKHLFMAQAAPIWNAVEPKFRLGQPNLLAHGIYKNQVNKQFAWQLGGIYFTNFSRYALLPIAGINYRFNQNNSISIILPFRFTYHYKLNDKNLLQAGLLFNGFSTLTPLTDTILRNRQLLLSFGYRNNASKKIRWFVTTSLAARGQVTLTATESYKQTLPRNLFLQAGFTYVFKKQLDNFIPETDLFNLNNLSTEELFDEE